MAITICFDTTLTEAFETGANEREIIDGLLDRSTVLGIDIPAAQQIFQASGVGKNTRRCRLAERVSYLKHTKALALELIAPVLPVNVFDENRNINVLLLPDTTFCYGPKEGVQIFGISLEAGLNEILYFFSHVIFHELSALRYTPRCRRVSERRDNFADERYWLMLLMRNEGIGNLPFIPLIEDEHKQGKAMQLCYFTYWRWLQSPSHQRACLHYLELFLDALRSGAESAKMPVASLKRLHVPAVNILGILMAKAIALHEGYDCLRDYLERDAECFFDAYEKIANEDASILRMNYSSW